MLCWYLLKARGSQYRPVSVCTGCSRAIVWEIAIDLSTTASSCLQPTLQHSMKWPHWIVRPALYVLSLKNGRLFSLK